MTTNFSNRRSRRLRFQPLEERAMMTGNIGVMVSGGDLYVTGDAKANNVAISQVQQNGVPVSGSYYIAGLDGTTINGRSGYTATGVTRDFLINMGGGGDSLLLGPDPNLSQPSSAKFLVPRNLNVDMGSGGTFSDHVGSTTLYMNGVTVKHDALIRSGYDNADHFYIRGNFYNDVRINSYAEKSYITMFDGFVSHDLTMTINVGNELYERELSLVRMNIGHDLFIDDTLQADSVYVHLNTVSVGNTLNIYTEPGFRQVDLVNDRVYLENVTTAALNITNYGFGYDWVELNGVTVLATATLNGSDGDDLFDIRGIFGNLIVNGGTGDDTVRIHDSSVVGLLAITESSLSNEHDVVSLSNVNVLTYASVSTGSGSDTVSIDYLSVGNRLTINTYDGNDDVTLTNTAADEVFAYLGAGHDDMGLGKICRFRRVHIDGGAGFNYLLRSRDAVFSDYFETNIISGFYGS